MAKTIVDPPRPVTGGVDTHLDLNVAAAVDAIGGLLGVAQFPTTSAGIPNFSAGSTVSASCPGSASRVRARTAPGWPASCAGRA